MSKQVLDKDPSNKDMDFMHSMRQILNLFRMIIRLSSAFLNLLLVC